MKKSICLMLTAIMMLGLLTGCGQKESQSSEAAPENTKSIYEMTEEELIAAAQAEGSVTFAVWHDEAMWRELGEGFTEKYGVKFEVVVGDQQSLTNKALAEQSSEKGTIDVMKVGGEYTKITMDANLFMGPTLPSITAKDVLDESLSVRQEGVDHNGYLVPLHLNQTGLLYNPDVVTDAPQTWEELEAWIDAHPGKFGFNDPSNGGAGQSFVYSVIRNVCGDPDKYFGDTEVEEADVANWDEAWQWFKDRSDKITITASNKDSISRLNSGELSLVVAWDDQTTSAISSGELFKNAVLYIPSFGMAGGGDTAGIMANAPHPAASLLLLNYFTSEECQVSFNEVLNTYPARSDVPVTNTTINSEDFVNRVSWLPAQYKALFISEFLENVLMSN